VDPVERGLRVLEICILTESHTRWRGYLSSAVVNNGALWWLTTVAVIIQHCIVESTFVINNSSFWHFSNIGNFDGQNTVDHVLGSMNCVPPICVYCDSILDICCSWHVRHMENGNLVYSFILIVLHYLDRMHFYYA
jgi:hypothetical protein